MGEDEKMKRKIIPLFLLACICTWKIIGVHAESAVGKLTYQISNNEAVVLNCESDAVEIDVPAEIKGCKVTKIAEAAFSDCLGLKKISLPYTLTEIGNYAFENCKGLEGIEIPDNVKSIGVGAFYKCSNLKNAKLPSGMTVINDSLFLMCESLESITIPREVTQIKCQAFSSCRSLKEIKIPASAAAVDKTAFSFCGNLSNIEVSENNSFFSCKDGNLYNKNMTILIQYAIGKTDTEFTVPDSVTAINEEAFFGACNLITISIPDSVEFVSDDMFFRCDGLKTIAYNGKIQNISDETAKKQVAFRVAAKLPSVLSDIGIWNTEFSSEIKNYTIYVPQNADSIMLTAEHNGALTDTDNKIFPSGKAVSVPLSFDETTITLVYSCENYADSQYIFKIIKYEGTKTSVSKDKKELKVKALNINEPYTIILALYNENKLIEIQQKPYKSEDLTFITESEYTSAKVMTWDGFFGMKPKCPSEDVMPD